MLVSDTCLLTLIKEGLMSDTKGLLIEKLSNPASFKEIEWLVTLALVWETARRYEQTYNSTPGIRWVFSCDEDVDAEARWFAQETMRHWSGQNLKWLPPVDTKHRLPIFPKPASSNKPETFGCLPWLVKAAAWRIYKRFESCQPGMLEVSDVDERASLRASWASRNIPLLPSLEYRPYVSENPMRPIGATNFDQVDQWQHEINSTLQDDDPSFYGREDSEEEDEIEDKDEEQEEQVVPESPPSSPEVTDAELEEELRLAEMQDKQAVDIFDVT